MDQFWESFTSDPRIPANQPMRAADADRELVRTLLADAYADGRLTTEEYDDRVGRLLTSRTLGDLPELVSDLVHTTTPAAAPVTTSSMTPATLREQGVAHWRKEVQESVAAWVVPSLICTIIWIATGAGYFWPIFPIVFIGINPLQTLLRREPIIQRRMEKIRSGELEDGSSDADDDRWTRRRRSRRLR
ncbi:MAG: DUF1707 domain-containing protein [Nocardioides sp.]|nr:DUF1707 domain-containing protein [Nocardioides sp.]